jgi:hypothetical protein
MLLVKDSFTKYLWGESFPSKESKPVAKFLANLYLNEGIPTICQHDNGKEFLSQVFQEIQSILGVKDISIAPYHPQSDGQVERANSTIKRKLQLLVESTGKPWSICLPLALYNYNHSVHSTTKVEPFEALRGRTGSYLDDNRTADELIKYLQNLHEQIRVSTAKAQQKMVDRYSKKSKVITFKIGDQVLCKDMKTTKRKRGINDPLYCYEGEIVEIGRSSNWKYKIKWGLTGGPTQSETPGTLSKRWWGARFMKLKIKESETSNTAQEKQQDEISNTPIRKRSNNKRKRRKKNNENPNNSV